MRRRSGLLNGHLAPDLLAVDVGNSKVQVLLFRDGSVRCRWRLEYDATPSTWRRRFAVAARAARVEMQRPVPIVLASVAPQRAATIESMLRRTVQSRVHRAAWNDPWPFRLDIRRPHTVGADRLANVAGLVALGLRSGVAIDAGTAVTIDVLERGRFVGGVILPGSTLMARALHAHTALLPLVAVRSSVPLLGDETEAALQSGIFHGLRHAVRGLTEALLSRLGGAASAVVTGGQAEDLAASLQGATVEPDLLFHGLRLLVTRRSSRRPRPG